MKTLGYYNGKYGELEEMSIPMNDRVCWFGDGVYDAGPCRNYKIFAIDEHIDRFFNSAGLLDIEMPVTKQELKELLQEMVQKMDTGDLFVYFQVTRGTGIRNHVFPEGKANLWIMLKPDTVDAGDEPIKLITTPDTLFPLQYQDPKSDPVCYGGRKGKESRGRRNCIVQTGKACDRVCTQ